MLLLDFWRLQAMWIEGEMWYARFLPLAGNLNPTLQGRLLVASAFFQETAGKKASSGACYERGIALLREGGDTYYLIQGLGLAASDAAVRGSYDDARRLLDEAEGLARPLGNPRALVHVLSEQTNIAIYTQDPTRALTLAEEMLALAQVEEMRDVLPGTMCQIAGAALELGDADRAAGAAHQGFELARELDNWQAAMYLLVNLGEAELKRGNLVEAVVHGREMLRLGTHHRTPRVQATGFELLAAVAWLRQDAQQAARLLGAADRTKREIGEPRNTGAQGEYVRLMDSLRRDLGDIAWREAVLYGERLLRDDAVQSVLNTETL